MKKTGPGQRSRHRNALQVADPISLRLDVWMAPKYHPTPLSGGDRKALEERANNSVAVESALPDPSANGEKPTHRE
jgi:hypothetical protein